MSQRKKRWRLTIWAKESAKDGLPEHWRKTNHRELDQHEADLLQGIAINMGWHFMYRACDKGFDLAGRLVTVEQLP